ncbi:hypothetical protein BCIN_06g04240 [Botrytis cinerea B05.10]|uniref:Leucine rich repeat domain protein n=3 Tax=Botryotinia fuckeliana TaxID=40559 RepID=A0A384JK92_BOTFB|nr:hypothetical protein BCIN_06g04240 [Botrytis cinerea B05.10]ATZ50960.1 hypothetical protein BCIN_06g04240 [Botrytis cinerea B05.10]EMR86420.1 putative leucine rich repeat domain protein [Botrytis cinerea BcDW1]CCD56763.1 hypothetical protein BofuT4_P140250.1 [Botrytis cinerea T4]
MADELSLPRLIRDNTYSTSTFTKTNLSRKRVRDSPPPDSSDPPIFSSDDDPSVEKYSQKRTRRKQKFRGPWFDQQLASDSAFEDEPLDCKVPVRNKRTLNKKVDSGVFMGSDGTDVEDLVMENEKKAWSIPVPSPLKSRILVNTPRDIHAQKRIEKCLEDGQEYIDLSRMDLDHLENSTIRPLGSFVKTVRGYAVEPHLRIILSANQLVKLPAELFNLNRLSTLSLRGNNLQELPPNIGKLKRLEDLNVAQNNLGYLPYEILDLLVGGVTSKQIDSNPQPLYESGRTGRLYDFQLHPNPFYLPIARPESTENGAPHFEIDLRRGSPLTSPAYLTEEYFAAEDAMPLPWNRDTPDHRSHQRHQGTIPQPATSILSDEKCSLSYQCRTEVRFLDNFGQLIKGPMLPSDPQWNGVGRHIQLPIANLGDIPQPPAVQSRVQSLIEKALQSCIRHPEFTRLESHMEYVPPRLPSLLRRAEDVNYSGPTLCTICGTNFIVPRTEWIEWWEIEKVSKRERMDAASANGPTPARVVNERDIVEKLVPLMRKGCSWSCLPPVFLDGLNQPSAGEEDAQTKMNIDINA